MRDSWFSVDSLFKVSIAGILLNTLAARIKYGSWLSLTSVVTNKKIVETVNRLIPDKRISDIKRIDLAINATDLSKGRTVTFCRENDASLRDAVLASSCIPVLFPTKKILDDFSIDGGVFNNTPLKDVLVLGATDVFTTDS